MLLFPPVRRTHADMAARLTPVSGKGSTMKSPFTRSLVACVVAAAAIAPFAATPAIARTSHRQSSAVPATVTCPICHMKMRRHWSSKATKRVVVNHHYYYCCTACGFNGDNGTHRKGSSMSSKHQGSGSNSHGTNSSHGMNGMHM